MRRTLVWTTLLLLTACDAAPEGDDVIEAEDPAAVTSTTALLVVGTTSPLAAGDSALKARLQAFGLGVTLKTASAAASGDASGKRLVVVSGTASASSVGTKFQKSTVPVVTCQSGSLGALKMTGGTSGTDFGTQKTQTSVIILASSSDPMTAGLKGTQKVAETTGTIGWGKPSSSAVKVARLTTSTSKMATFRYEKGKSMVGLTAPARRVAVFLPSVSPSELTLAGQDLLDAALAWAGSLPAKKTNGTLCTTDVQCGSNACVKGLCCNTGCHDVCMACNVAGHEGTCFSVPAGGADPQLSCEPTDPSTCGTTGVCDGNGLCAQWPAGSACSPASCSDSTFTPASLCDGNGTCVAPAPQSCDIYACNAGGCNSHCATDADCAAGNRCDMALGGVCTVPRQNGARCNVGRDCASNVCANGLCCNTPCDGSCNSCITGTCTPLPSGTSCGPLCTDSNVHFNTAACDSAGVCRPTGGGRVCTPFVCRLDGCVVSCTTDMECVNGSHCDLSIHFCR
jgi:hypothetical protein